MNINKIPGADIRLHDADYLNCKKTDHTSGSVILSGLFSFLALTLIISGCRKDNDIDKQAIRENYILQFVNEISPDSLRRNVDWLQDMNTRFMLAGNHRDVALKIKSRFTGLGYNDTKLDSFFITNNYKGTIYNTWQYNVVATLEGALHSDSICILGAHYDNIISPGDPFDHVPGANDNASGVAATLEIARLMKKNSFIPGSTIKFVAFAAEELGLIGSHHFADKCQSENVKIRMMLNNDMIAYQPSPVRTDWEVNIIDYPGSDALRAEAEKLCTKYTTLKFINDNKYSAQSDSYPFYLTGYKSLFFIESLLENTYHTVNDLSVNMNFSYSREIVKISCAMLLEKNYIEQD